MKKPENTQTYTYEWYISQFQAAKERTMSFSQPINNERFIQRPAPNTWSIAECYGHLIEFGNQYLNNIRGGLQSAEKGMLPMDSNKQFPPRLVWKGVIKFFAPPYRLKMKTVGPFTPPSLNGLSKTEVLKDFITLQDTYISELQKAQTNAIDLNNIKVQNPLLKFVNMSLAECFAVVEVHQRRHFWQAEQILRTLKQA